jgi:hypothetical protein
MGGDGLDMGSRGGRLAAPRGQERLGHDIVHVRLAGATANEPEHIRIVGPVQLGEGGVHADSFLFSHPACVRHPAFCNGHCLILAALGPETYHQDSPRPEAA